MRETFTIDRSPEKVFAAITAFDRIPEWIPSIKDAYQVSPGAPAVGTTFAEEFRFLGFQGKIIGTITALEPRRALVYEYAAGPIPGSWSYRLSGDSNVTRVDFMLETPSRGLFSTSNPAVFALVKREIRKNLASLKSWIERD
jgi:uncharacterized protein YndB with AHSA1/START domain